VSHRKVAIVTDWIYGGGGERVVEEIHALFPNAPIYTSYCSDDWRKRLNGKVITGYLQKAPFRQLRKFLPLLRQWWFSRLDLSEFDLIISVTGNGEAKFARATNGTHVCYCHTPVHFYWRKYEEYLKNPGIRPQWLARLGLRLLIKPLRKRDYAAAQKVNHFLANSSHIQSDIKKFYNRDSVVIHPPVDTERFVNLTAAQRDGFVTIGRQTPYKRTDIIIEACSRLNLPLTVVGRGPEHDRLRKLAGPSVRFDTNASDDAVAKYLSTANAFLFAAEEDFGIAPVEALAAGTPVIAYRGGGALDYVIPGKTGEFFDEQTVDSLCKTLEAFNHRKYFSSDIKLAAQNFGKEKFAEQMLSYIGQTTEEK